MLSMGEGDTPLVESRRLGKELGIGRLFFKLEGCNPTGSFKDRGMVVAVAKALEAGHTTILCASTGNTSASAAAYGAAAGLETVVLIPAGQIAAGKLSQAVAYGARVIQFQRGSGYRPRGFCELQYFARQFGESSQDRRAEDCRI
jgi:threonine synthase